MDLDQDEEGFEVFCNKNHRYTRTPMKALMPTERIKPEDGFASCNGEFEGVFLPPNQQRIFSFLSDRWAHLVLSKGIKTINLFGQTSHLQALMPNSHHVMHLITYQNGIKNSPHDFKKMGVGIAKTAASVFGYTPLCIGFYNPTSKSMAVDTMRALLRYLGMINLYVIHTAIWFETLLSLLKRNPNLRWMHITHSEGGAIAYLALKMIQLRREHYNLSAPDLSNHLILSAFGPLHPIPKTLVSNSFNFYNCQDRATLRFGAQYMDPKTETVLRPGYGNIDISHSNKRSLLPPGDHAFLGQTYQRSFEDNLKQIKDTLL